MAVDCVVALILHFVHRVFESRKELKKLEAIKKNDELHEKKKTADRAFKTSERDKKRNVHNNRGNYKTHEKRNHNPTHHHIQQPSKR